MAQQDFTNESAVFYGGVRRNNVTRPSKGSGKTVKIHDDLHSALVHEVVEQLNEARDSKREELTAADAATTRKVIASSKYDLYIEDITLLNGQTAPFSSADTDIRIAIAEAGDIDLQAGPSTVLPAGGGLFFAEGFGVNNLAGGSEHPLSTFDASKTDALTVGFSGPFILRAGQALYAEFVNNEGAEVTLGVRVDCALTDRLSLNPKDLSRKITLPTRRFLRKDGRSS